MRKVLIYIIAIFSCFTLRASHFIGGEITWECISDPTSIDFGKYIFQMKIYRDCTGIPFGSATAGGFESLTVYDNPLVASIDCFWESTNDISPTGVNNFPIGNQYYCYDCTNYGSAPNSQKGKVVMEHTYRSLPTDLGGNGAIPPVTGWHFAWGSSARNAAQNMTSAGWWLLRAIMYPYTKNTSVIPYVYEDVFPCFDSSPVFKEKAKTVLCLGDSFAYSHLAFDPDFDSLSYNWAYPLEGTPASYNPLFPLADSMSFATPFNTVPPSPYHYSLTQQLPSDPAGPLSLNNSTGEISFIASSNIQGIFLTCVKVTTVKCFQVISEVFREVQVVLSDCGVLPNGNDNSSPVINQPVGTQTWYTYINSAGLPSYYTTIMAGELVEFDVNASDVDMQNLSLEIEGSQVDLALALSNPATFNITSSSAGDITGRFSWPSSCDHLQEDSCAGFPNQKFTFNLKAYDDYCPANGTTIANLTIYIIPPTPDFRCVAVDPIGDVELSWYFPTSLINAVIDYDIYFSKNKNGPYNKISTISFPDSTYIHNGSDAHISSSFYYLVAKGACVNSLVNDVDSVSDTLQTIYLDATAINSVPIVANLLWNPMRKNNDPATQIFYEYNVATTNKLYSLYYQYDNSLGFDMILQHPDTLIQKRSDYCNYDPNFYIEIDDARGCVSRSNIATTHLADDTEPDIPVIKDVSVNSSGQSVISWEPTNGAELYAIYLWSDLDGWISIDTVFNAFSYVYLLSEASEKSELFSIRALDSCNNESLASYDLDSQHNSIFLEMDLHPCNQTVQLEWNEYINWDNGLSHYKVIVEQIDTAGVITNAEYRLYNQEFLLDNIIDSYNYTVYIEAYNLDSSYVASSNVLYFTPDLPRKPDFNYIEYASIIHESNLVEINCFVDNQAIIDYYDVLRTVRGDNNFNKIGEISFNGSTSIYYYDQTADIAESSYQYRVFPVDTCGIRLHAPPYNNGVFANDTSYAETILLETKANQDYNQIDYSDIPPYIGSSLDREYTNTLIFNEYEEWLGKVAEYRLYRSVDGGYTYNALPLYTWDRINNPEEVLEYIDIVTEFGKDNGRLCYYIHAIEGNNSPYGPVIEGSYSNISCISQTPVIFIPSTFTPNGDGHNEIFYPISFFVDEQGYSFAIYNRNGTELFATTDPKKGWDGRYLENLLPNGNYVYHLQYINGIGELVEKIDVVTLIR